MLLLSQHRFIFNEISLNIKRLAKFDGRDQSHHSRVVRCPWPIDYDVIYQTIHSSADSFNFIS